MSAKVVCCAENNVTAVECKVQQLGVGAAG
jgi:hypothetical protein